MTTGRNQASIGGGVSDGAGPAPRSRSHWGWGYEDKFADRASRQGMGSMVAALLGGGAFDTVDPVPLAEVVLPAARAPIPRELVSLADASEDVRVRHTYGRAYRDLVRGFGGDFAAAPDFVAYPGTEAEVAQVLEVCAAHNLAAIPFGGGSSVVGGVEGGRTGALGDKAGVVSVDLCRLSNVLEVDDVSRAARIQAGMFGPALERALGAEGFTLRHFPQSFEFSTLGGWLATRAGGHFATGYTHIDDLLESARMVTPRGIVENRRVPATGAGPEPKSFMLGSEGAYGIITEAWMRIRPKPRFRARLNVAFAEFSNGVAAARALAQSGLMPTNCRLLCPTEAKLHRVRFDGKAVLIIGFESHDHPLDAWLARAAELAVAAGGEPGTPKLSDSAASDPAASDRRDGDTAAWRDAFVEAPYLFNHLVSLGVLVDTFETACTWSRFAEVDAAIVTAVGGALDEVCGGGVISRRFTHVYENGPAPYYTFVAPARRGSELSQWAEVKQAASDAIIASGATITHHHAVGRMHHAHYVQERNPLIGEAIAASKRTFDPSGICNPGVLVGPV